MTLGIGCGSDGGCPTGFTECSGECVDTGIDVGNCGGCGTVCDAGEACVSGQCGLVCAGGTSECDGACVDTQVDPSNCGGCADDPNPGDNVCGGDELCVAGTCEPICATGAYCDGLCVDTDTDVGNCGGCANDPNPGDNVCVPGEQCMAGVCEADATYFFLSGTPDPSTVFDAIDVCFSYPNNLTNGIWHRNADLILVGEFQQEGYWSHPADQGGHPATPDNGTGGYRRMVYMPFTNLVAYTVSGPSDGMGPADADDVRLATIDRVTGELGAGMLAQFGDGYSGTCNVLSSSADELLCLENATTVRRYATSAESNQLELAGTVTLSQAIPAAATCVTGSCYGGTFAWDGVYYYFSRSQSSSSNLDYDVFDADGTFVETYSADGEGSINGAYFDWSVGRYAIHDGFGNRAGTTVYASAGSDSDTQCYGPVSTEHTLRP